MQEAAALPREEFAGSNKLSNAFIVALSVGAGLLMCGLLSCIAYRNALPSKDHPGETEVRIFHSASCVALCLAIDTYSSQLRSCGSACCHSAGAWWLPRHRASTALVEHA